MPSAAELIAHGREVEDINASIGSDGLIFQSLDDLIAAVRQENPEISRFETSVFDGQYITGGIDQDYLNRIDKLRNDSAKSTRESAMSSGLELHNQEENGSD
jgi:amidophosphoribosyltransferase